MTEELVDRAELLGLARTALAERGGVLLHGPAGIGKTALLNALGREAEAAGTRVLRSSPAAAEADLPHLALIDLLGEALHGLAEDLPTHLRLALERALLHSAPEPGAATDPLAVRVAVLESLRRLAARTPVLVLLDDTQWLDEASRQVISFCARRLADHRVGFVVTERGDDDPVMTDLCPAATVEIPVGPLSELAVGTLLQTRLGLRLSGFTLTRVHTASGGNAYYALELGRSLGAHGNGATLAADPGRPLGVPERLRALLASRLAPLPQDVRDALTVLATARPGTVLPRPVTDRLATAEAHGVLVPEPSSGAPRFAQPLLAEVVRAEAGPAVLRSTHALLATLATDPVERARHLALACDTPDPELADRLDRAAATALSRGAPGSAAELLRLAAGHTGGDPEAAGRRLLAAARHAASAGLPDLARACCEQLPPAPGAEVRVHARLLVARLLGPGHPDAGALLADATAEAAGSPALVCAVRLEAATRALQGADITGGLALLEEAERHADASGDADAQIEVIALRAVVELLTDPVRGLEMLERGRALALGRPLTKATTGIRQGLAIAHVRSGATGRAVTEIESLRADVERAGRTEALCEVLHITASVYERAGRCADSRAAGRAAYELRERIELDPGPARVLGGAAELAAGTVGRAIELLDSAILAAGSGHDPEWLAYAFGLRGRADLLRGEPGPAVTRFSLARDLLRRLGYRDPALFLLDADLAEAQALTGDGDGAAATIRDGRERADRLGREVVLLGLHRAQATLESLTADPRGAADTLRALLPDRHPYPLELARAHLSLGQIERRARRRAAARDAFRTAAALFEEAGCTPWLHHTEDALAALDPVGPEPTPVQRDIIGLLRTGATNREIATALHLSVKAVEGNLTRVYRHYRVRNRGELARLLTTPDDHPGPLPAADRGPEPVRR